MKIIVTRSTDEDDFESMEIKLETREVSWTIRKADSVECPEDAKLSRALGDFLDVPDLSVAAYNAGKNGEILEVKKISSEDKKWKN